MGTFSFLNNKIDNFNSIWNKIIVILISYLICLIFILHNFRLLCCTVKCDGKISYESGKVSFLDN